MRNVLSAWGLVCLFLVGCASTKPVSLPPQADVSHTGAPQISKALTASTASNQDPADLERLAHLWQKRTHEGPSSDYPIGPGDLLQISVPSMEELNNYQARVSAEGSITLPLVGVVPVAGLTEQQTREEVQRRLQKSYMYDPQV